MAESTWTGLSVASRSTRKQHKGAASKRLIQVRETESHNTSPKSRGWLDLIRDAASKQGQVWDPEYGWVNYAEPEVSVQGH